MEKVLESLNFFLSTCGNLWLIVLINVMVSLLVLVQASEEDDCGDFEISEDVIRQYKANEQMHARERLALRQTLRQKFESMQQRNQQCHEDVAADMSSTRCKDASTTVHA